MRTEGLLYALRLLGAPYEAPRPDVLDVGFPASCDADGEDHLLPAHHRGARQHLAAPAQQLLQTALQRPRRRRADALLQLCQADHSCRPDRRRRPFLQRVQGGRSLHPRQPRIHQCACSSLFSFRLPAQPAHVHPRLHVLQRPVHGVLVSSLSRR